MKTNVRFVTIATILLGLAGCSPQEPAKVPVPPPVSKAEPEAKALDILIDWQAEPTYLGIYYAKSIGAFKALGYDVTVIQSWGANEAAVAVSAGKYKIGTASGAATIIANSNGASLLSTAVLYPRLPTAIFGLEETGIKKPKDLEGKTVGIYAKSITRNEFEAFAKLNKVDLKKVNIVSLSGPDLPLVLAKKVDAVLNYFELSPTQLALERKTSVMMLDDFGVKSYGLNIITSKDVMLKEPVLVNGITQAIIRGYREGCANKEAAVAAFMKEFPDKNKLYVTQSWDKVCGYLGTSIGQQTVDGWKQTIDLYAGLGLLPNKVDAQGVMTSESK